MATGSMRLHAAPAGNPFPWDVDCPDCGASAGELCHHVIPGQKRARAWCHRSVCASRRTATRIMVWVHGDELRTG